MVTVKHYSYHGYHPDFSGGTSGGADWEKMVSSIADGALDMSGSHRRKQSKHSTKLR